MSTSMEMKNVSTALGGPWWRGVMLLLVFLSAGTWIGWLIYSLSRPLLFDDAYMFYRYAVHMRQGLGMSWNLDGVHTYGETSPLWGFTVLLLSYLPMSMSKVLVLGSWLCSVAAIVALAWSVAHNARSSYISSTWRVLPMVAVPFVLTHILRTNAVTGMETMMATLLCALYAGLVLGWAEGDDRPEMASAAGLLLFLVRPEAALVIVSMPALAYLLLPGITRKSLVMLLGLFLAGFALDLIICKYYFGSPLPLSFYMKTQHGYEGYHASWGPVSSAVTMLISCWPYLLCLGICVRRADVRRTAVCLLPALLMVGYLFTVMQIMGYDARYYVPYLALVAVPALLALDRRLSASDMRDRNFRPLLRAGLLGACLAASFAFLLFVNAKVVNLRQLLRTTDRVVEHRETAYDPVHFQVAARTPLPTHYWFRELKDIADDLMKPLPRGSTIAASEVGYLGGAAPDINVIDLAGLNDPQIALHGFSIEELLARRPDIIWMPHTDYTYQRGVMLSDPHLLEQYDVIVGGFGYGIALRKDSPVRPQIDRGMRNLWNDLYPGLEMKNYLVQSASWSGEKHRITDNDVLDTAAEKDQFEPLALR